MCVFTIAIDGNPSRPLRQGELAPDLDMVNLPTRDMGRTWLLNDFSGLECFTNGDTLVARTPWLENGKIAYVAFLQENQVD